MTVACERKAGRETTPSHGLGAAHESRHYIGRIEKTLTSNPWYLKAGFREAVDLARWAGQQWHVSEAALKTVGDRIRRMREERRLSQEEFAQLAKLDRSYYGRVERGGQNLALKTIMLIAKALQVAPSVLLADLTYADCEKLWDATQGRRSR